MIVLVFGLPGSGKTFFSEHLADETGAIHLNTDMIRQKLNKTGQYDEKSKKNIYEALKDEMVKNLKEGNDVIVDGTFFENAKRIQFEKAAAELRSPIKFIEIKAEEPVIRKRLNRERVYSEADYHVYQKIKRVFEPYDEPHLELWSTNDNITEMIQEAKKYLYG